MSKTPKKDQGRPPEVELEPDAWERFQKAVHTLAKAKPHHREAIKSAPKHRTTKKPPVASARKKAR